MQYISNGLARTSLDTEERQANHGVLNNRESSARELKDVTGCKDTIANHRRSKVDQAEPLGTVGGYIASITKALSGVLPKSG